MKQFIVALLVALQLLSQTHGETLPLTCGTVGKVQAQYFSNMFNRNPVAVGGFKEYSGALHIDAGKDSSIDPSITSTDLYGAVYSGIFRPTVSGMYQFKTQSDDGGRLSIDGVRVAGLWSIQVYGQGISTSSSIRLEAGQAYLFQFEYNEERGFSQFTVSYKIGSGSFNVLDSSLLEICHYTPVPIYSDINCALSTNGLRADFYGKNDFTNYITSLNEKTQNGNRWEWNSVTTPNAAVTFPNASDFGVIYKGAIKVDTTGLYRIYEEGNQNGDIYVGDMPILVNSQREGFSRQSSPFYMVAGKYYNFEMRWSSNDISPITFTPKLYTVEDPGTNTPLNSGSNFKICIPPQVVAPIRSSMTFSTTAKIPVTLRTQPTGTVTVTVSTTGSLGATPCTLTFTSSNWNIPQYVYASTSVTDGEQITFTPSSTADANYNNANAKAKTWVYGSPDSCSTFTPGATCFSYGDPHYGTFDGDLFDYHTPSVVYLTRTTDSEFVVQAQQAPCGSGSVSCNYAVAIKYQEAVIQLFISAKTGTPTLNYNSAAKNLGGLTIAKSGVDYTFTFPNTAQVEVKTTWWGTGKTYYLSIYITVPTSYQTKTRGLCGTYNGDKTDDYHDVNGNTVSFAAFTSAWTVPTAQNLVANMNNVIPPLAAISENTCSLSACTAPPPLPPACVGTECNPSPPPPTPPCSYLLADAQTYCATFFLTSDYAKECAKIGVDTTSFYDLCVTDVFEMCDPDAAVPHACSFQIACSAAPVPQCPCLCNLNGDCVANNVCSCTPPFDGDSCDNNPDSTPCSIVADPVSGPSGKTIKIYASDLPTTGGSLQCQINGQVVPAVVAADGTHVTCTLPTGLPDGIYPVEVLNNGQGTNCGAQFEITSSSGGGDPHFNGFNGEKMEVKRDENAANQLYHLYCSEDISITTLFYQYEDGLLFMTKYWVRLGQTLFTLNLSAKPKILTSHEEPQFLEELGRFRVEIPDGHLEWDDNKLRVIYKYLKVNFSTHVYLQGSSYMNVAVSIGNNEIEQDVTGIIGRTLHNSLTPAEFEKYEQFKASVSDVISFQCSLPLDLI